MITIELFNLRENFGFFWKRKRSIDLESNVINNGWLI